MTRFGLPLIGWFLACALLATSTSSSAATVGVQAASISSFESAINLAGRQRMLSQRIIKAYCQIGLGVEADSARVQLDEAIDRFERHLGELKTFSSDALVVSALDEVGALWSTFRSVLDRELSPANARLLHYLGEDLLYATNKVVLLLQDTAGKPEGRLINIAGRQRMLCQRLAKLYLLRAWGINTISMGDEATEAEHDFGEGLEMLRNLRINSEEMTRELDEVVLQWAWFQNVLQQKDVSDYRLIVINASESILDSMEKITRYYERLSEQPG